MLFRSVSDSCVLYQIDSITIRFEFLSKGAVNLKCTTKSIFLTFIRQKHRDLNLLEIMPRVNIRSLDKRILNTKVEHELKHTHGMPI